MKPLAIDLYCGLGGWTDGLLAEGYDVIGFDIEQHAYGDHRYPAQLVLQDVRTLHGSQFKDAALIVASPPCQFFSYTAMPWSRAKALAAEVRADPERVRQATELFDACFRIQREAIEASGHFIPLVVENVRGAIPWVGRSRWNFGSFHLWGDVPALMPMTQHAKQRIGSWSDFGKPDYVPFGFNHEAEKAIKNSGGSWFNIAHNTTSGKGQNPDGRKTVAHLNARDGLAHTRHLTNQCEHDDGRKQPGIKLSEVGFNVAMARQLSSEFNDPTYKRTADDKRQHIGSKRKAASALIAKIPLVLARHIGRVWYPADLVEARAR